MQIMASHGLRFFLVGALATLKPISASLGLTTRYRSGKGGSEGSIYHDGNDHTETKGTLGNFLKSKQALRQKNRINCPYDSILIIMFLSYLRAL